MKKKIRTIKIEDYKKQPEFYKKLLQINENLHREIWNGIKQRDQKLSKETASRVYPCLSCCCFFFCCCGLIDCCFSGEPVMAMTTINLAIFLRGKDKLYLNSRYLTPLNQSLRIKIDMKQFGLKGGQYIVPRSLVKYVHHEFNSGNLTTVEILIAGIEKKKLKKEIKDSKKFKELYLYNTNYYDHNKKGLKGLLVFGYVRRSVLVPKDIVKIIDCYTELDDPSSVTGYFSLS